MSWGVMERATGIEPARSVTMHGLRHAYASWLLAGGADLHLVKERLGHAKMTTEGYLHTLPSADETALVALSRIRGGGVADEEAELIVAMREIGQLRRPLSPCSPADPVDGGGAVNTGIGNLCAMFRGQEVQEMKVRNSLKSLKAKDGSYVVRRRGRAFVMNKRAPRLKARQG